MTKNIGNKHKKRNNLRKISKFKKLSINWKLALERKLPIIWLIFTLMYFLLGTINFIQLGEKVESFSISDNAYDPPPDGIKVSTIASGWDINKALSSFESDLNNYIEDYNRNQRNQNRLSGIGYYLAGLIALLSMFFSTIKPQKSKGGKS